MNMTPNKSRRRRRPRKKKTNSKKIILITLVFAIIVIIVGYILLNDNASNQENNEPIQSKIRLETSMGSITIQLRDDMPITTTNFKNLIEQGVYDNTFFHRVVNIPGNLQIVQGGDPTGTGFGDSSIPNINDEFSDNPENNQNKRGTIAMANAGPNTGSSQFFINGAYNSDLDNLHPVFGDIIDGMNIVDSILNVDTEPDNRPLQDVLLTKASIIEN